MQFIVFCFMIKQIPNVQRINATFSVILSQIVRLHANINIQIMMILTKAYGKHHHLIYTVLAKVV